MKVVDLFAGCGGLSLGFEAAGFEMAMAIERWDAAREVYQKNFEHPVLDIDLNNVIDACKEIVLVKPDIIIGGPPCQEFSMAGVRVEGERAELTYSFGEIICNVKPTWFVLENVPGIRNSATWKKTKELLINSGYGITETVLNAAFFNVPQNRKRFFAIGKLGENHDFLKARLETKISSYPMTIREYTGGKFEVEYYYRHPRNWGRKGIFSIDEPAPTVRSTIRQVPPGYKPHPDDAGPIEKARALNFRELAIVQTFPSDYNFFGTSTAINTMIANAVPVQLAKHLADCINDYEEKAFLLYAEEFRLWLQNDQKYTKRTASNVISRIKRVSHIINIKKEMQNEEESIRILNKSSWFKLLTPSVKSQIRKAIKLKFVFDNRAK